MQINIFAVALINFCGGTCCDVSMSTRWHLWPTTIAYASMRHTKTSPKNENNFFALWTLLIVHLLRVATHTRSSLETGPIKCKVRLIAHFITAVPILLPYRTWIDCECHVAIASHRSANHIARSLDPIEHELALLCGCVCSFYQSKCEVLEDISKWFYDGTWCHTSCAIRTTGWIGKFTQLYRYTFISLSVWQWMIGIGIRPDCIVCCQSHHLPIE